MSTPAKNKSLASQSTTGAAAWLASSCVRTDADEKLKLPSKTLV